MNLKTLILVILIFCVVLSGCTSHSEETDETVTPNVFYIININSKKVHKEDCGTATLILQKNKKYYVGELEDLFKKGYTKCGNCFR